MYDSTPRQLLPVLKLLGLLALITLCGSYPVQAQRDASASKSADITVFAGFTYSNPDYASYANDYNHGVTAGADYTRYFRWRIVPSLEARASYNTGIYITEKSALGGLRLKMDLRAFHPYVNALVGGGEIVYAFPPDPGHPIDRTFTTSIGGGVDIDLIRSFQAKIDLQREFQNFGPNGTLVNNADFTLTPTFLTVGIVYRIPFHGRSGDGPRR